MIVILLCLLCTAHEVCLLHTEHTEISIDDYVITHYVQIVITKSS